MNSFHFVSFARPPKPRSAITRFSFARSSGEEALFAVGSEASIMSMRPDWPNRYSTAVVWYTLYRIFVAEYSVVNLAITAEVTRLPIRRFNMPATGTHGSGARTGMARTITANLPQLTLKAQKPEFTAFCEAVPLSTCHFTPVRAVASRTDRSSRPITQAFVLPGISNLVCRPRRPQPRLLARRRARYAGRSRRLARTKRAKPACRA